MFGNLYEFSENKNKRKHKNTNPMRKNATSSFNLGSTHCLSIMWSCDEIRKDFTVSGCVVDSSGIAGCKCKPVVIVEVSVGVCEIETPSELASQFSFCTATPPTAAIFEPTDFFVELAALFFASKSLSFLRVLYEISGLSADEWCV